jgi:hypothetical protein
MLAREAPVSAVSLAEKNAETSRQPTRITNVSQSMTGPSLYGLESGTNHSTRRIFRYQGFYQGFS